MTVLIWLVIAALSGWRIFVELRQPHRLKLAKRIVLAVIVALLVAAALVSAEDATTDVIVRCQKWWCWPWG
jgi:hypothetical protein